MDYPLSSGALQNRPKFVRRCPPYCVVPENIHTPTTEGSENFGAVVWGGGGQRPRKFRRGGELSVKLRLQMVKSDAVTTQFENRFLSTFSREAGGVQNAFGNSGGVGGVFFF